MGLLEKAEERKELLEKLTKEKKKYVDHISKKRKKVIHDEIKKQRKIIKKAVKSKNSKKLSIKKVKPKVEPKKIIKVKKSKVKKLKSEIKKKEIKLEIPELEKPLEIKEEISKIKPEIPQIKEEEVKLEKPKLEKIKELKKEKIKEPEEKIHPIETEKPAEAPSEMPSFEAPAADSPKKPTKDFVFTGVTGFDDLLVQGIPQGTSTIIAGGAGSGKTIFCLQTLIYHASHGEKCLYMSFEEPESRLIKHMQSFGWNPKKFINSGKLKIMRMNPFDITRNVDALLAEQKGELLIDVDPVIIPKDFKPDFVVVDSLTAIASAFTGKEENYYSR